MKVLSPKTMKPRISVAVTIILIIMLPKVVKCAKHNDSHKHNGVTVKCNEGEGKDINEGDKSKIDEGGETEAKAENGGWQKTVLVGTGAVVGGVGVVVAAPFVVGALGFGAGGITAGSYAASMMSAMAPTAAGGIVATLQSVGAAGLSGTGTTLLAGTGAVTSGVWLFLWT